MKFSAIFGAILKEKESSHTQLLMYNRPGISNNKNEAYSYITILKPSKYVLQFYHIYQEHVATEGSGSCAGLKWKSKYALNYSSSNQNQKYIIIHFLFSVFA